MSYLRLGSLGSARRRWKAFRASHKPVKTSLLLPGAAGALAGAELALLLLLTVLLTADAVEDCRTQAGA